MAELDVEKLKREIYDGAGGRPVGLLSVAEWQYIARSLEDRDRLRAALKNWHRPHFPGTGLCVCANCEELAALEGHDG